MEIEPTIVSGDVPDALEIWYVLLSWIHQFDREDFRVVAFVDDVERIVEGLDSLIYQEDAVAELFCLMKDMR